MPTAPCRLGRFTISGAIPPFGIKDGLLPILAVAFILSMRSHAVLYRQGIFQARMTDLETDYLTKDPTEYSAQVDGPVRHIPPAPLRHG